MDLPREDEDRKLILSSPSELEEYLSSSVILWRLRGSSLPLSPGNLLLARLRCAHSQAMPVDQALKKIDDLVQSRRSAWERKVGTEIPMRLQQWKTELEDIQDAGGIDQSYPYNIRVRVIISLLLNELRYPVNKAEIELKQMDDFLMKIIIPGGFIWDEELKPVFPPEKYGYLYVQMKGEGNDKILHSYR
jgi:hypothetical protein